VQDGGDVDPPAGGPAPPEERLEPGGVDLPALERIRHTVNEIAVYHRRYIASMRYRVKAPFNTSMLRTGVGSTPRLTAAP
jgi:hypothetical protein